MEIILSIAGSDCSAGAGIQQDLKTVTAMGHYCATVVTAVTAQNTLGVSSVMPVTHDVVTSQLMAVLSDLKIKAIKTGMIPNRKCAEAIVDVLRLVDIPIVCDPVMISTSGTPLMSDDCIDYIKENLFPLCRLVTPNIPEAERLNILSVIEKESTLPYSILIKGGHAESEEMTDRLIMANGKEYSITSHRIDTHNLHGTGCTLSSAIAVGLAEGRSLPDAVKQAKQWINKGIEGGKDLAVGHGNGPLWFYK